MSITAITMPRWGLTMEEGTLTEWLVPLDGDVTAGMDIVEIETTKLSGTAEAASSGTLRRQIVAPGQTLPVGALLGIIAEVDVGDAEIDEFISEFKAPELGDEEQEGFKPQTVEVDGQLLSYMRQGEGVPVVFVHGFGGDAPGWGMVQNDLAQDCGTISVDLPGHGASGKTVRDGSLRGQASVLAGFIRALDLGEVHLVGHSMGGGICMALASAEPDLVASLTLVAPMGLDEKINAEYLDLFIGAQKKRDIENALRMLFFDESMVTRGLVDDVVKYKRLDGVDTALATIRNAILVDERQAEIFDIERIGRPTTLIAGAGDRIIPPGGVAARGGVVLDGVGHMPQVEHASAVSAAIRTMLPAN